MTFKSIFYIILTEKESMSKILKIIECDDGFNPSKFYVDLRSYYKKDGEPFPTQHGVYLTSDEFQYIYPYMLNGDVYKHIGKGRTVEFMYETEFSNKFILVLRKLNSTKKFKLCNASLEIIQQNINEILRYIPKLGGDTTKKDATTQTKPQQTFKEWIDEMANKGDKEAKAFWNRIKKFKYEDDISIDAAAVPRHPIKRKICL